jgi:hypothetical protein
MKVKYISIALKIGHLARETGNGRPKAITAVPFSSADSRLPFSLAQRNDPHSYYL